MTDIEPTSWWIYRDLEGTALGVTDEQPEQGTIQSPSGVWMFKVSRPHPDRYEILKRAKEWKMDEDGNTNVAYELVGTIHRLTKAEFDTHIAFELFPEDGV
jgi:hypothetical protein